MPPVAPTPAPSNGHELQPTAKYAEADRNPFPEVVVSSLPEPLTPFHPSIQPDNADAIRGSAAPVPVPETKWEKTKDWAALHKCWLFAAGLLLLLALITTIITVAVVSRHSVSQHHHSSPDTSSTGVSKTITATLTNTHISSRTSSTSSASATPKIRGCEPAKYVRGVSWMGISGVAGGWKWRLASSDDAAACCALCFKSTKEGCNSWAFMPTDGSTSTACNIIFGWPGDHVDKVCPKGHADVRFSKGGASSYAGGPGPCGQADS